MVVVKKKRERIKNRDQSRDYVNGPTLQKNILEWYDERSNDPSEIPDIVVMAILQIIERLGTKYCYRNYSYLEEMKGDAIEACIKALQQRKYKAYEYDNPFAYFTQIANNAFINVINNEAKQSYVKQKSLVSHNQSEMLEGNPVSLETTSSYLDNEIISKFETKMKKKTKKSNKLEDFTENEENEQSTYDTGTH
jgi:DNA-directed RNA polymerase specialized sigma24 family protein